MLRKNMYTAGMGEVRMNNPVSNLEVVRLVSIIKQRHAPRHLMGPMLPDCGEIPSSAMIRVRPRDIYLHTHSA